MLPLLMTENLIPHAWACTQFYLSAVQGLGFFFVILSSVTKQQMG